MTTNNINLAMCLKDQKNIGETVVHNICDGSASIVPWGAADWVAAVFFGGMMGALGLLVLLLVLSIAFNRY